MQATATTTTTVAGKSQHNTTAQIWGIYLRNALRRAVKGAELIGDRAHLNPKPPTRPTYVSILGDFVRTTAVVSKENARFLSSS